MMVMQRDKNVPSQLEFAEPEHNDALLNILKSLRNEMADAEHVPAYNIVPDNTLQEMATYFPVTHESLLQITGFGSFKANKYGSHFTTAIATFLAEAGLVTRMDQKPLKLERKAATGKPAQGGTQQISLQMFNEGQTLEQIAGNRGLSPATIATHLEKFVETGELDISKLIEHRKLNNIIAVLQQQVGFTGLKTLKEQLGDDYTFTEIKWTFAHLKSKGEDIG